MCAARSDPDTLLGRVERLPPGRRLTPERTAGELARDVRALAERLPVARGEAIGLRLPVGEDWIVALLGLLHAGAAPLLIAEDTPAKEVARLLATAGGRRELVADGGFSLTDEPPAGGGVPGVLVPTSGSTGEPKVVLRDEPSFVAEGLRYEEAAALDGSDRLLLPLPLTHAYALGWLAAALVTGTEIRAYPPSALSAIARELAGGATIIALVPTLARLLVLRQRRRPVEAPKLRLAMIGAGAVDERLDREFQAAFGLSTGRNYGSTETGAVFCGLADLPPLCIGTPMPGVEYRIGDGTGEGAGLLEVRLDGTGPWRRTGDIAARDGEGRVRVLGRRHGAIRKGGRWIAPLEVEAVLREHPAVRDAHVRAQRGRFADEDLLVADVAADGGLAAEELLRFAGARLSAHKVPDRLHLRRSLPRNSAGKAVYRQRRYRLAGTGVLAPALRAYRASELLFALADLGLIESLRVGADVDELVAAHGLPAEQLHWLLDIAADLGLVLTGEGTEPAGSTVDTGLTELIGLESRLSAGWLGRRAISEAVTAGRGVRPFETVELDPGLLAAYQAAMHGPHTAARTRLGLRLLRKAGRVLEVSAGPGRYLGALLEENPAACGHLTRLGRLAGPLLSTVDNAVGQGRVTVGEDPPAGAFDACVVANGIHGPGRGEDLAWLFDRLVPGGVLLIDDIFLPADGGTGAEIGLDWLTHGGTSWPRVAELEAGIEAAGGGVARIVRLNPPECCLILVKEER